MEKTVLVVGAGLSVPYGYPSGERLVSDIISRWKNNSKNIPRSNLAKGLESYAALSIDRYLSEKTVFLNTGISIIAEQLVDAEVASLSVTPGNEADIFKLLLNQIQEPDFPKLTIISFNYDRLFEWRFLRKLKELKGSDSEAVECLSKMKIEHVHGRLAPINSEEAKAMGPGWDQFCPYGFEGISDRREREMFKAILVKLATEHFKTVYTNDDKPNEKAVAAIKAAKRVFFLGFGFDEKNMYKLGIGKNDIEYDWASKCVAATCLDMRPVGIKKVERDYKFLSGRLFPVSAYRFFTDHFCLTDATLDPEKSKIAQRDCCEITARQSPKKRADANTVGFEDYIDCLECNSRALIAYSRGVPDGPWDYRVKHRQPKN